MIVILYTENDFNEIEFLLHRVNHSIWFGQGLLHINIVEGLWSYIKRITNNFSRLTFKILFNLENEGINAS